MGGYENIVIIVSIIFLRRYRTPFLAQVYSTEEHESKLTQVYTRVWAWVTEYMQVSMLVNTMLYFNKRYLHIFNHPRLYPSIYSTVYIQTVNWIHALNMLHIIRVCATVDLIYIGTRVYTKYTQIEYSNMHYRVEYPDNIPQIRSLSQAKKGKRERKKILRMRFDLQFMTSKSEGSYWVCT